VVSCGVEQAESRMTVAIIEKKNLNMRYGGYPKLVCY